jgi:hypothetical protein
VGGFEEEIGKTRPPDPTWSDLGSMVDGTKGETQTSRIFLQTLDRFAEEAGKLSREEMGSISLGSNGSCDSHLLVMHLNSIMKKNLEMAPNTLFIGGTNNESSLIFFRRPMRPTDFLTLWGNHPGND